MFNLIQHLFLPHHTNNHRARLLHIDALFVYMIVFVVLNFSLRFIHRQYPDILGYATDIRADQLLADTNAKRQELGLAPLRINSMLSEAAAAKAANMFAKGYWAHVAPDGETPWDFIVKAGYKYTVAGENLAKNFSTSQNVVDAWMASPTHRDNIVKPQYQDIGFAVVNGVLNGEETTLVVQMFGAGGGVGEIAAVPPANAVAPNPVQIPQEAPIPVITQQPAPVVIPAYAVAQENPMPAVSGFFASIKNPIVDIPQITRIIVFVFVGFLLGVLAVDGWVVRRQRIVRVAGHNVAHVLFLIALLAATGTMLPGSVL